MIEAITLLSSIIGLVGFFIANPVMFYVGGAISFIGMIRYYIVSLIAKDKNKIRLIKENRSYQRTKYSEVYYAKTEKEVTNLKNRFLMGTIISRVLVYGITLGAVFYFFSWNAYIWVGIAFGLCYVFTLPPILFRRKIL